MKKASNKNIQKVRRETRVRKKLIAIGNRPRLTVFRSNLHIYAQIIDDSKAVTLASASSKETEVTRKMEQASAVGKLIAQKAIAVKVTRVAFDKGSYKFHGRVKALAEGAREGGLVF